MSVLIGVSDKDQELSVNFDLMGLPARRIMADVGAMLLGRQDSFLNSALRRAQTSPTPANLLIRRVTNSLVSFRMAPSEHAGAVSWYWHATEPISCDHRSCRTERLSSPASHSFTSLHRRGWSEALLRPNEVSHLRRSVSERVRECLYE